MSKHLEEKQKNKDVITRRWNLMLEKNRTDLENKKNKELEDLESEEEDLIHG